MGKGFEKAKSFYNNNTQRGVIFTKKACDEKSM